MKPKNRTIFTGDNLDVLREMDSESVDLIYLDPPFNSNRDYEAFGPKAAGAKFEDIWTMDKLKEEDEGRLARTHPKLHSVVKAAGKVGGKSHMAYMVFMGLRIIQMHRVLKKTGSLYLHCDPTMSHPLKMALSSVFGESQYRNEIIWKRTFVNNRAGRVNSRVHDSIYFFTRGNGYTYNKQFTPYSEGYLKSSYKYEDDGGRYGLHSATAPQNAKVVPFEFRGVVRPWRFTKEKMERLYAKGLIERASPRACWSFKRYLDPTKGIPVQSVWSDIKPVRKKRDKTDYPTQKPLELLWRIINASTNRGDVVLDPFCGCATACVAAESLGREWIGIDVSDEAVRQVKRRLHTDLNYPLMFGREITVITQEKARVKREAIAVISPGTAAWREWRDVLFGKQSGTCPICERDHFEYGDFVMDHVTSKKMGGTNKQSNFQLLCGPCNSIKGAHRTNDEAREEYRRRKEANDARLAEEFAD